MNQVLNDFSSYELTEEEVTEATTFTAVQRAYFQNLLSEAATSKVNLTYDPSNPLHFAQREAELQGEIGLLRHLLSN